MSLKGPWRRHTDVDSLAIWNRYTVFRASNSGQNVVRLTTASVWSDHLVRLSVRVRQKSPDGLEVKVHESNMLNLTCRLLVWRTIEPDRFDVLQQVPMPLYRGMKWRWRISSILTTNGLKRLLHSRTEVWESWVLNCFHHPSFVIRCIDFPTPTVHIATHHQTTARQVNHEEWVQWSALSEVSKPVVVLQNFLGRPHC